MRVRTIVLACAALLGTLCFSAGPVGAANGPILAGDIPRHFTDYGTTLYTLKGGSLYCQHHDGAADGSVDWSDVSFVGNGFDDGVLLTTSGVMYYVKRDGTIRWYRHDGHATCGDRASDWTAPGGKLIGTGWTNVRHAFGMTSTVPGMGGVIYTIDNAGNLSWHRHVGWAHGGDTGADWQGGTVIATGWNNVLTWPGENGQIYTSSGDGNVWEYVHIGWQDGSPLMSAPMLVATGWYNSWMTGGPGGLMYGVHSNGDTGGFSNGDLKWWRHTGHDSGAATWQGPIRQGVVGFPTALLVYSPPPPA